MTSSCAGKIGLREPGEHTSGPNLASRDNVAHNQNLYTILETAHPLYRKQARTYAIRWSHVGGGQPFLPPLDVRFTPESGQRADVSICPLCAKSDLTHRSKKHRYSITSFRLFGFELQGRCSAFTSWRAPKRDPKTFSLAAHNQELVLRHMTFGLQQLFQISLECRLCLVDLVFDVIGGDIQKRSAGLIRAGGRLVSIVGPAEARPADGLAVDFVVESDRTQLSEIVQRVRDGRLRTNIGTVSTLDDAVAALNPTKRISGKPIIRVRP